LGADRLRRRQLVRSLGEEELVLAASDTASVFQYLVHFSDPLDGGDPTKKAAGLVVGGLGVLVSYEGVTRGEAALVWRERQ
jgi:hypothetical protein